MLLVRPPARFGCAHSFQVKCRAVTLFGHTVDVSVELKNDVISFFLKMLL